MNNNIGVFLYNTHSDITYKINLHNFNILKNNFKKIIIIDIENYFSKLLEDLIMNEENKNVIYMTNDNCKKNIFMDLNVNAITYFFDISNEEIYKDILEHKYITFISDNYIYCNDLIDYFKYINDHPLDFYAYSDSSEKDYHCQLYFFSVACKSLDKFKEYMFKNKDNNDIEFNLLKIFDSKIPFLKVAYINDNVSHNIFYNHKLFKKLFINKLLPIINIQYLYNFINNYNTIIHTQIPFNFDIEIYRKYDDLKDKSDVFLHNHFLVNGQFENRNYSNDGNYILPNFIRSVLKSLNLLYFFDVPDNFTTTKYKEYNKDIASLSDKELYIHWINYGKDEGRVYC